MRVQQGTVGYDFDGNGHDYFEFPIVFTHQYKKPPIVQASVEMFDGWSENGQLCRFWSKVENIELKSAIIRFGAWDGYKIGGCRISWIALGV